MKLDYSAVPTMPDGRTAGGELNRAGLVTED